MKEQLLLCWQTANSKNNLLLQHLSEDGLQASLSNRGRTVGEQLAHLPTFASIGQHL